MKNPAAGIDSAAGGGAGERGSSSCSLRDCKREIKNRVLEEEGEIEKSAGRAGGASRQKDGFDHKLS